MRSKNLHQRAKPCCAHASLNCSSQARSDPDNYASQKSFYTFARADETIDEQLARLHEQVATIKPAEEQLRLDFIEKFGRMIDEAREVGMEVDFINPLTAMMKKLSENALEYKELHNGN